MLNLMNKLGASLQAIKVLALVTALSLSIGSPVVANDVQDNLRLNVSFEGQLASDNNQLEAIKDTSGYDWMIDTSTSNVVLREVTKHSVLGGEPFSSTYTSQALVLGEGDRLDANFDQGLSANPHTLAFWVKASAEESHILTVKSASNAGYVLKTDSAGHFQLVEFLNSSARTSHFDTGLSLDTWQYVTLLDLRGISGGEDFSLFVDGVKVTSTEQVSGANDVDVPTVTLRMGNSKAIALDDIKFFNRQINLTEIQCLRTDGFNCVLPAGNQDEVLTGPSGQSMSLGVFADTEQNVPYTGTESVKSAKAIVGDIDNNPLIKTFDLVGKNSLPGATGQSVLSFSRHGDKDIKVVLGYRQGENGCTQVECPQQTEYLSNVIGEQLTDYDLPEGALDVTDVARGDSTCNIAGDGEYLCVQYNNSEQYFSINAKIKGKNALQSCETAIGDPGDNLAFKLTNGKVAIENGLVNIYKLAPGEDINNATPMVGIPLSEIKGAPGASVYPDGQEYRDCRQDENGNARNVGATGDIGSRIKVSNLQIDSAGMLRLDYLDASNRTQTIGPFHLRIDGEVGTGAETNYKQIIKNAHTSPTTINIPSGFTKNQCHSYVRFGNSCTSKNSYFNNSQLVVTFANCGQSSQNIIMACAK